MGFWSGIGLGFLAGFVTAGVGYTLAPYVLTWWMGE